MFISFMILGVLLFLISVAPAFENYAFLILFADFFFSGFGRSYAFIPFYILNQHFDGGKKDKEITRLWVSLGDQINVVVLLSFNLMMYTFHWHWQICIIISTPLSILIQIIFYLTMEEVVAQ